MKGDKVSVSVTLQISSMRLNHEKNLILFGKYKKHAGNHQRAKNGSIFIYRKPALVLYGILQNHLIIQFIQIILRNSQIAFGYSE